MAKGILSKTIRKDPNIYEGVVVAETISKHGHRTYGIDTGNGTTYKESAYIFSDKELAKAAFDAMMPKVKLMYEIQKKLKKRLMQSATTFWAILNFLNM